MPVGVVEAAGTRDVNGDDDVDDVDDGPDVLAPNTTHDNPFLAALGISLGKRPRRLGAFHFYQRATYKVSMLGEYNRRITTAKLNYDALPEEAQMTAAKPEPVRIRTEIAKEFWATETQETRDRFAKEAEEEFDRDMEEWESLQKSPMTPIQYRQLVTIHS